MGDCSAGNVGAAMQDMKCEATMTRVIHIAVESKLYPVRTPLQALQRGTSLTESRD